MGLLITSLLRLRVHHLGLLLSGVRVIVFTYPYSIPYTYYRYL